MNPIDEMTNYEWREGVKHTRLSKARAKALERKKIRGSKKARKYANKLDKENQKIYHYMINRK